MEPRNQFTFYRSYWEAIEQLPPEDRHAVLEAIIPYALFGTEPQLESQVARTAFILIRPTLDSGRKKAEAGRSGNVKRWQTDRKPIANESQTDRKGYAITKCSGEGEIEKEIEIELEKEAELEKENEGLSVLRPPPESGRGQAEITLPLKDGSEFGVSETMVLEFTAYYPGLDIRQELRSMRGWLIANPDRRKTAKGIRRFVNGWLTRSQEQARKGAYTHGADRLAQMIAKGEFDD